MRRERDDLLAQVDERLPQPVEEREEEMQPGLERAAVAAEALDDAGVALRHDAHRLREHDEHREEEDRRDDEHAEVVVEAVEHGASLWQGADGA